MKIKFVVRQLGIVLCLKLVVLSSCEEFLEIGPPKTQIVSESVFKDDASAKSAINGIYEEMIKTNSFASGGFGSLTFLAGLSSDELLYTANNSDHIQFNTNTLQVTNAFVKESLWEACYKFIYYSNAAIEGLSNSSTLSESNKSQLLGEAKFLRAFCHFYILNLFSDAPLITSTDYRKNSVVSRESEFTIYKQIITDLKEAQASLPKDYTAFGNERIRPNRDAATSLLARVYLFTQDWTNAELQSSQVIDNTSLYSLESNLNEVFLANSSEAIWQLKPVLPGINTNEGSIFILTNALASAILSSEIINSFDVDDQRFSNWIGSTVIQGNTYYFPFKYKVLTGSTLSEYSMVFRLAEQFLIRAEARAQQNKLTEAIEDIDIIRSRAGLPLIRDTNPLIGKEDILLTIEKERQVELFSEWGHRWLDLKRTGRIDAVLSPLKSDWDPTDKLYPIPQSERDNNINLTQNLGY